MDSSGLFGLRVLKNCVGFVFLEDCGGLVRLWSWKTVSSWKTMQSSEDCGGLPRTLKICASRTE